MRIVFPDTEIIAWNCSNITNWIRQPRRRRRKRNIILSFHLYFKEQKIQNDSSRGFALGNHLFYSKHCFYLPDIQTWITHINKNWIISRRFMKLNATIIVTLFQSTRTDQNNSTKFYKILRCQIEPFGPYWTKKVFPFFSVTNSTRWD